LNPIAFISSFFCESGFADFHDSPLWQLRREIFNLKEADEFGTFRQAYPQRDVAWVAEHSEPPLRNSKPFEIVDRLVEVLEQSEIYICILADARRGEKEHGSPVDVGDLVSATSYFEIELYAAAMHAKPVHLFIQEGFSPGPRLEKILRLLSFVIPDWKNEKSKPPQQIIKEVWQLMQKQLQEPMVIAFPLRKYLVRQFYLERAKNAPPGHEMENVLFLDGEFETRRLPQKDLIEELLTDYERVPEMQRKLSRMWMAARELMSASYLPKDVQADSRLADFLPLWKKVLEFWTGAASWSGWHGHIYAGPVAPLNSQAIICQQLQNINPPLSGLASAYYSIAKLLPFGFRRLESLHRSYQYIQEAIRINRKASPNNLAIRGSIKLHCRNYFGAVSDFKQMLQIREQEGASEEQIADAMVHLGFGYLFCGRWWKGRDYLERGVHALMIAKPDNAGLARAKRKLAFAYKLTGKFSDSEKMKLEANADAFRLGAFDQLYR